MQAATPRHGRHGFGERSHVALASRPRPQTEARAVPPPARRGRRPARRRHDRGRTADRCRRSTARCRAARSAPHAPRRPASRRAPSRSMLAPLRSPCAISLSALIFGPDRPSRASLSARARRTASGWNGSNAATSRPQIAAALAVETCWPHTMAASPQSRPAGGAAAGARPPPATAPARVGRDQPADGAVEIGLGVDVEWHARSIYKCAAGATVFSACGIAMSHDCESAACRSHEHPFSASRRARTAICISAMRCPR